MAIAASDIKFYESTAAGSLGGAITGTQISNSVNAFIPEAGGDETEAGSTKYLCFYVKNTHGTLTYQNAKIWIDTNTPSTDTEVELGVGTSGINGTEQTVADINTAPAGVTFDLAEDKANGLTLGSIPAGQHIAVWLKLTISAEAAAYSADGITWNTVGETAA